MGKIGHAAHRLLGPVREGDDAIEKLVIAGASAGVNVDVMIELLNAGMSTTELITYIEARRSAS